MKKLVLLAFILATSLGSTAVLADSPHDYGREFGLFVHAENKDLTIPRVKGQQVLHSYFMETPLKASFDETKQFMTQREFLLDFEKLRLEQQGSQVKLHDNVLYPLVWLKARRMNWLPNTKLTYDTMQEFLYRYAVSMKHGNVAYYDGLVLDPAEISVDQYKSITQVRDINNRLTEHAATIAELERPTRKQKVLLASLQDYRELFVQLEDQLEILEHPLNKLPSLPDDIRRKILDHDLNEVLDSITYNYSSNNANRIHNLTTGAMNISGKMYQPGEVMDLTDELGSNGWWVYKYGWVIFGGEEVWQFGGGLCGTATITFTPSWRAGLEVVSRHSHSIYYRDLYPEDSLGLDATIYRGAKNLIMRNNTSSPILYYAYDDPEKQEVTMYVIGNSPYRNIEIEGPIVDGRNTYKWIRRMERFDGTVVEEELVTRYGVVH